MDYEVLLNYCQTDNEFKYINACIKHGSQRKGSEGEGISVRTIQDCVRRLKSRAAKQGYSPDHDMLHTVPDGYRVKGVSTLYKDGQPSIQWVKSDVDKERQLEMMQEAIKELCADVPKVKPTKQVTKKTNSKLLNLYTFTDYHLGMYAWAEETGGNWDTGIAEQQFMQSICDMINRSPDAETGMLNLQGDFLHSDGMLPVTPTNHHVLDQDSRYHKLVRVAIRMVRFAVSEMLKKHKKVIFLAAQGNHDLSGSVWMQEMFSAFYEGDNRVSVISSPNPFYCVQHGKSLLAVHHGHTRGVGQLGAVIAAQFPEIWGATKYRYVHCGHRHHKHVKEDMGIITEQHQTLAAKDAHSAHGGYFAERGAVSITYHEEHGEYSRLTIRPTIEV